MFCPNCGKDCAEGKFCPECGHEVSSAIAEKSSEDLTSRIPLGKHKGVWCSLELGTEGLTICKTFARKDKATYIPYTKLTKALLVRQHKAYEGDYLLFRWEGNRQLLIPEQKDMVLDDATICFMDSSFLYHVFCMLKCLAPATAVFSIENNFVDIPDLKYLAESFDLAACFEKYNPRRDVAVKHLKKEFGIKHKEASQYVDQYFDMRFDKLYADNPEAVFLDLDRAIKGTLPVGNDYIQQKDDKETRNQVSSYEDKYDTLACAEDVSCVNILSSIPFDVYKGVCSSLELKKEGLIVHNSFSNGIKTTYIPYDKLTTVLFFRTYDYVNTAYLLLRWEGNQQLSVPELKKRYLDVDSTTVAFVDSLVFYHIFCLLKFLAPSTAKFRIENGSIVMHSLEAQAKTVDLNPYYEQYNPCREEAVKMLRKDTGMKKKAAKVLIDQYFDSQHKVLYAENPEMIFRDLDRAIKRLTPKQISFELQKAHLEASGMVFCPKCLSTDITFKKVRRRVDLYTGYYQNSVIKLMASIHKFLLSIENSKNPYQIQCRCQKCQYVWLPLEK